jgi:hypothetical protein
VPLSADSTFGAPVAAANRLFVPDYKTGEVWIVDLTAAKVLTRTNVLSPGGPFQLMTRDGVVFFNDPRTDKAGVLQLDGSLTKASKYDPANPSRGLSTGGQNNGQDNGQNNGQNPDQKPGQTGTQTGTPGNQQQGQDQKTTQKTGNSTANPPPGQTAVAAKITVSNASPKAGEEVTLQAKVTPAAEIKDVSWTFGDGDGTGELVKHTWKTAQDTAYLVTATVTLKDGRTAQDSTSIPVHPKSQATLTVKASDGGKVVADNGISCGADCTETVEEGTRFHLTAQPDPDFKFTGWAAGPCKQFGMNPCDLQMGTDNIGGVQAGFTTTKATLTVNVPDAGGQVTLGGNTCTTRCPYTFEIGTPLQLGYGLDSDHDFAGWENGCPGTTAKCRITADTSRTIVAHFKIKSVTLKVHAEGGGKVTGPASSATPSTGPRTARTPSSSARRPTSRLRPSHRPSPSQGRPISATMSSPAGTAPASPSARRTPAGRR